MINLLAATIKNIKERSVVKIYATSVLLMFSIAHSIKQVILYNFLTAKLPISLGWILLNGINSFALALLIYGTLITFRKKIWLILFYTLSLTFDLIHLLHFTSLGSYFSFGKYLLWQEGLQVVSSNTVVWDIHAYYLLIDLPFLLILLLRNNLLLDKQCYQKVARKTALALVLLSFVVHISRYTLPLASSTLPELIILRMWGFAGLHVSEIFWALESNADFNSVVGEPVAFVSLDKARPNFLFLQLESIDSAAIEAEYNGQAVMPFLKGLTKRTLYYPYTLTYRVAGGTSDAEIAVNCGVPPPMRYPVMMKPDSLTLKNAFPHALRAAGYETNAYHAYDGSFYNREQSYPRMGYRHFIDLKEMALSKVPHGWGASDEQFFNYLKNRLKTARTPYSFQAISLSSHLPYDFVEGLWLRDFSKVQDPATRRYFNCISYVDSCLKNFFEGLDLSNTWIFVYGDHTPMDLQVSDDYKSSYVDIDGNHLEFVPLIILGPRLEARRIKTVASLLDIAPTVLKLSGVEYRGHLAGEDLISTGQLNKPLPFKGNYYNRDDLFHRVLASSR